MNRLLVMVATTTGAAALAAVPAVLGLVGNPSFSHQLPVHVPSQVAKVLVSSDPAARAVEPGDDRARSSHRAPPTSARASSSRHAEPGDDNGGATRHAEPGDDHRQGGGSGSGSGSGSGRGGSDDATHSGGRHDRGSDG